MQKEQATTKYKAWLNLTYIILSEDSQTQREHAVWFPLFIQSSETGKNTYGDRSRNSGYLCQELMTGRECEKGFWVLIMLIWGMVIWGIYSFVKIHWTIYLRFATSLFIMLYFTKSVSALIVTLIACICVHCCWFYKTVYTLHSFWKAIWQYLAGAIQMSIFLSK